MLSSAHLHAHASDSFCRAIVSEALMFSRTCVQATRQCTCCRAAIVPGMPAYLFLGLVDADLRAARDAVLELLQLAVRKLLQLLKRRVALLDTALCVCGREERTVSDAPERVDAAL